MLGKLISAVAGQAVARQVGGRAAGPVGMILGAALPAILRRFGPLGLVGVAAGSYAVKKFADKRAAANPPAPLV